jgi:hypothetical protein
MAASLLSAFGGAGGGAGDGLGALGNLVTAFSGLANSNANNPSSAPGGGKNKKQNKMPASSEEPIVDMAKQLGSVFASNFLSGLTGQGQENVGEKIGDVLSAFSGFVDGDTAKSKTEKKNNKQAGPGVRQDNPLGSLMAMLPLLMGNAGGGAAGANQLGSIINVIQEFSQSDYWKTGKEMFSKIDSHQIEAFGKMVTQVRGIITRP